MKVTKEDVDKAKTALEAAVGHADDAARAAKVAVEAAEARADKAWNKYIKLKEEFENESN